MIVLDENLKDVRIRSGIEQWYQGQVLNIRDLRPNTVIKDEAIATLLRQASEPTFVTINTDDFWNKVPASPQYCIVVVEVSKERSLEIPTILRNLLRADVFKSKASRMGKVIHWTPTRVEYQGLNRRILTIRVD